MSRTLISVPMKDPAKSKTRLAHALDPRARARLACLLYRRTLDVLAQVVAQTGDTLSVVTCSETAVEIAEEYGVDVLSEPENAGLSHAVHLAAQHALRKGYQRLCIIPADLAAPSLDDLLIFLESSASVTLCPSTDQGTNALLVSPPDAITFQYGLQSAIRHTKHAQAQGLTTRVVHLESLSFDVDTDACLTRAMDGVPDIARICA